MFGVEMGQEGGGRALSAAQCQSVLCVHPGGVWVSCCFLCLVDGSLPWDIVSIRKATNL